jgi:DNA-binding MarR family transcriptional regulator
VLLVDAGLEAHGWVRADPKAVIRVIAKLQDNDPTYKTREAETLRRAYYLAAPFPPPLAIEEDRWMSLLMEWGKETKRHPAFMSAEQARDIVNRLIAVASHRRADLNQLFVHLERLIHWNGRQKIKWLQSITARLAADPSDWPIFFRRGRPNVTVARIETYLANAPGKHAHKRDIVAVLKIPKTTVQTTLISMKRAGRIVRAANGVYALPTEGVSNYLTAEEAIVKMLAAGPSCTNSELIAGTGHTEAAVHAAIHRLAERGKIIRKTRSKRGVRRGESYTRYGLRSRAHPSRRRHRA